ncbi:hypothetical protein C8J57DRAFT_1369022 [Mycena rebaudengoi]|nr:hypothetical protein C8J57DRAFT_1369022 [Mycena rebaudengoi]
MSTPVDYRLVATTLGAVQIGVLVNSLLYGIVFMQWVSYVNYRFKDGWMIQALVYSTLFLDTAHTAISWEYLWMYTVRNFGNASTLVASHWEYDSGPIFIILCAAPIQFFLAFRIRKLLSQAPYRLADLLFGLTATLCVIQMIFGLYMSANLLIGVTTTAGYVKFVKIAVAWESFAIATDGIIMLSSLGTVFYLRTGFKHTNWLLFNVMIVSVECAIPVTLFTIGHMTAVISSPTTGMHQLFAWSQARLYSNTLFVTLNSRGKVREGRLEPSYNNSGNEVSILGLERRRQDAKSRTQQVRVNVTREEEYAMDTPSGKGSHSQLDFKEHVV